MTVQQVRSAPTSPEEPGSVDRRTMRLVFTTVALGMLLAALDQTIVSTALPTIVGDLGGAGHLSWVVSAYLMADTIATVLAGKAGDPVRPQAGLPGLGGDVRAGLGRLRLGAEHELARLVARGSGVRRRRSRGHRDGPDRGRDPFARARQVPGRTGCRVRCHHRARPAGGRTVHRSPVVAVGVLR